MPAENQNQAFFDSIAGVFDQPVCGGHAPGEVQEIDFWTRLVGSPDGPVAELGAGTGRITLALLRRGIRVVASDAVESMLAAARERVRRAGLEHLATFHRQDAQQFRLDAPVPLAISVGLFFHLPDLAQYARVLRRVRACLRPGGRFIFDVEPRPNPAWPTDGIPRLQGVTPYRDGQLALFQVATAGPDPQLQAITFLHCELDHTGTVVRQRVVRGTARWVTYPQMASLASETGFEIEQAWGDYDGNPYQPDSPALVLSLQCRP